MCLGFANEDGRQGRRQSYGHCSQLGAFVLTPDVWCFHLDEDDINTVPDGLHNPGSRYSLDWSGLLVRVPNAGSIQRLTRLTIIPHRPLNPGSVTKDIAHAVDLVRPSYLAIHPSKLEAVESALTQLGLAGPTKPNLFTVIERSSGLSLVSSNDTPKSFSRT